MNKIVACLLILLCAPAVAQKKDKSWRYLFNGKDLSGWKQINGKAPYSVDNGMLVGTTVSNSPNSFLVTEETFGDFILEVEFMLDDETNTGIQFRSESKPDYLEGRVFGYQVEIDPSPRKWCGGIYDESRRQWLYPLEYNPPSKNAFKNKLWNSLRVEAIGASLRTWINGVPCSNVVDDMTPRGFIALQVHSIRDEKEAGKKVWFKNIRIKTENLQPSPTDQIFVLNLIPNTLTQQETLNGVTLLWDGKTTQGWRRPYSDKFPEKGWEIKDGALNVMKSDNPEIHNGGDIITVNEYSAFDLQFEFKLSDGANSGVKYFVTESEKNKGAALGLEYQVLDDDKHPDARMGVVGNRTLGGLYDLIPPDKNPRGIKKIGEWNQGRVVVYPDNKVEHWLNGYKVVEYQRSSNIYKALVARSKYAQLEDFGMADKGHILLQDHGDAVSYRSIKIRLLK